MSERSKYVNQSQILNGQLSWSSHILPRREAPITNPILKRVIRGADTSGPSNLVAISKQKLSMSELAKKVKFIMVIDLLPIYSQKRLSVWSLLAVVLILILFIW